MSGFDTVFPLISAPGLFGQFLKAAGFFDGGRKAGPPLTDAERLEQAMNQMSGRTSEDTEGIDTAILEAIYNYDKAMEHPEQSWSLEPVDELRPVSKDNPMPSEIPNSPSPLLTTGSAHDSSPLPASEPFFGTTSTGPESGQNQRQQSGSNFPVGPVLAAGAGGALAGGLFGGSTDTSAPAPGIPQVPPVGSTPPIGAPVVESQPSWVNPNPQSPQEPTDSQGEPWWLNILKGLTEGIIPGLGGLITGKVLEEVGGSPGERLREFFRDAYPGTNPWEHLGSSAGSGAGSQSNQMFMQTRELDNRLKIAQIQAQAQVDTATISSEAHIEGAGISSQPGHRQAAVSERNQPHQAAELTSRSWLNEAHSDLARSQTYNTEVKTLLDQSALQIADEINQARLNREQATGFWTVLNSLATGRTDIQALTDLTRHIGEGAYNDTRRFTRFANKSDNAIRGFGSKILEIGKGIQEAARKSIPFANQQHVRGMQGGGILNRQYNR